MKIFIKFLIKISHAHFLLFYHKAYDILTYHKILNFLTSGPLTGGLRQIVDFYKKICYNYNGGEYI